VIGYGLGIVTGDINLDGWPDIYIGNDFHENDYLYINQGDGTFKESLTKGVMHTSQFSMGVDVGDLDNDGWSEIFSLDMLPEDPYILKRSLGEDEYGLYQFKLTYGYHNQYARNTLQKNNADAFEAGQTPTFSEVGMFAGVHATDWSWASLFMDFDNDGNKDLFISNGIERRMNDIDYANFRLNDDIRFKQGSNNLEEKDLVVVERMPQIKIPNKFFKNTGKFRFNDLESDIKAAKNSYSNGAIYADLDNDGDLDVVVNNLEETPFLYKNLSNENPTPANGYLTLQLTGSPGNVSAIGARAVAFKKGEKLVFEHFAVRGFQSSSLSGLHLGLGDTKLIDSILLIWPDRTYERLAVNQYNTNLKVVWRKGLPAFNFEDFRKQPAIPFSFSEIAESRGLSYTHIENSFVEFNREGLIPHMVSREGPALAVGDVNGDGLEDVFFGSSKRQVSALYLQKSDGTFVQTWPDVIRADSTFEDADAVFVDIENDGDQDLVVASGGNEYRDQNEPMRQRIYVNDGKGNFSRQFLEGLYMTASCVLPADFNKDGLIDLFFGARAKPWNYGITPASALLLNKGGGVFEDITAKSGGGMSEAGMVKNGAWTDLDKDGDLDLLLAIEWAPPTVFINNSGSFKQKQLNDLSGWWNFMYPADFDSDGDVDFLAGNLGSNNKFRPSKEQPVRMYVNDFDDNQQVEQILTYYVKGREVPFANYDEITKQMPSLKKKYLLADNFAKASLQELFGKEKLGKSILREANTFESMYFENDGKGNFIAHKLPDVLQYSPIMACSMGDFNGDGVQELMVGGNFYEANIEMGRYDANFGNVLSIGKGGQMSVYPLGNLRIRGQVRHIEPINVNGKQMYVWAKNDDKSLLITQ
ncbi:MAG: VCBS repeat-containing protein, partial [Saprospiraceae bacterium]|nr:VCBS repeat-containing protein [Saprospiraceae bacterium]